MSRSTVLPVAVLLGATGVLASAGWGLTGSDAVVGAGFDRAVMAAGPAVRPAAAPAVAPASDDLFKLSKADGPAGHPFGLGRPVGVGDKITIAGRDGQNRVLEVSEVRPVGAGPAADAAMLLVTCVTRDGGAPATIRFVVEGTGELRPALHRAL
jgi:hypothetical protein